MAGHSKFKNIQFRKGAQDKKRAKVFSKLAREITTAAKLGIPDPAMNPRLRSAIQAARAQNMPNDNIDRAIAAAEQTDQNAALLEGFKMVAAQLHNTLEKHGCNTVFAAQLSGP